MEGIVKIIMITYNVKDFLEAAITNNLKVVSDCLAQGLSADSQNEQFLSPFIASAANGQVEIFQLLLEQKPDLNQVNKFGGTALIPSSEKGFIEIVEIALTQDIPVNHINRLGWSALLEAVVLGNGGFLYQDIIRLLLLNEANSYQQDFDKKTSYDYAEELNQIEVVQLLQDEFEEDCFEAVRSFLQEHKILQAINELLMIEESAKKIFYLGQSYERLKRYEDARSYYEQGLLYGDTQFYFYLANCARRQGNLVEALSFLDQGIEETNTYFYRYQKSNFLRDAGKHEEALVEMNYLLQTYPERVDFLFHQANSLEYLGNKKQAIDSLQLAHDIQSENPLFLERINSLSDESN